MTISVVIATFNRAALLAECLDHLARQRFEPGDEVILVDNGSTDSTREVIAAARSRFAARVHHLEEPMPGKSRAVARALAVATGDVLAFTDDDVNVDASWLDEIRAGLADPATTLAGGPVEPRWQRSPPAWLRPAASGSGRLASPLALLNYGPDVVELGPRTVLGANLAVRREAFMQVGGFAPHLGKLRHTLLSGEDHDLCRRIQAAGLRAVYLPRARVYHWVPSERMSVRYYLSWFFWSGITNATIETGEATAGRSVFRVPLFIVKRTVMAGFGALASVLVGNVSGAIERAIDVAFATGYAVRCRGASSAHSAVRASGHQS